MFKISDIFSKSTGTNPQSKKNEEQNTITREDSLVTVKNWYEERSDKIIVQRNILTILLIILAVFMVLSTLVIAFVVKSKQFDPFVIQLDNDTGRASIVKPNSASSLMNDESLTRYFIKKYLIARETYNPVDFTTIAHNTVRLFSTSSVYYEYLGYIRSKDIDPSLKYKQDNTTFLLVKSWSKIASDKYIVRFSVHETAGEQKVYHKISVLSYSYVAMELTDEELDINPVGLQVNEYRVDDDNS